MRVGRAGRPARFPARRRYGNSGSGDVVVVDDGGAVVVLVDGAVVVDDGGAVVDGALVDVEPGAVVVVVDASGAVSPGAGSLNGTGALGPPRTYTGVPFGTIDGNQPATYIGMRTHPCEAG